MVALSRDELGGPAVELKEIGVVAAGGEVICGGKILFVLEECPPRVRGLVVCVDGSDEGGPFGLDGGGGGIAAWIGNVGVEVDFPAC